MTSDAKRALAKTIRELREKIILPDLREATTRAYQFDIDAKKATLSEAARAKRSRIEAWLDEQTRWVATKARRETKERVFDDLIKDAGATLLQRLVYLRLLEANGLRTVPIVTGGWDSRGYKDFREVAPDLVVPDKSGGKIRDDSDGFSTLLALVFDELALELPGLFGPVRMTALVPVPAATLRSIIKALDDVELASAWTDDTTLGWIYQYWNDPERESLDRKLAEQKKLDNNEIASKTQMFTERYMVEWLLHNSLGQLWLAICQKHGWTADVRRNQGDGSVLDRLNVRRAEWLGKRERGEVALDALMPIEPGLEDRWKYWVPQPMTVDAVTAAPASIRDVKLLDPACGSGHFLVIAFELLFHLYKEEAHHRGEAHLDSWNDEVIVDAILANNVHGIDIDPRAVQIAAAALTLKAKLTCKSAEAQTINLVAPAFRLDALGNDDPALRTLVAAVEHETGIPPALTKQIVGALSGADHLGSLLKIDVAIDDGVAAWHDKLSSPQSDQGSLFTGFGKKRRKRITGEHAKATLLNQLERFLSHHSRSADLGLRLRGEQLAAGVRFMRMVREGQYDLVVGNPPYQGTAKLDSSSYVDQKYKIARFDLYSAFLVRALEFTRKGGLVALVTRSGWMFQQQFSDLRLEILRASHIRCIADLMWCAFENMRHDTIAMYVISNAESNDSPGVGLVPSPRDERDESDSALARKKAALLCNAGRSSFRASDFMEIPEQPLIFWWPAEFRARVAASEPMGRIARVREGIGTKDDTRFLRRPWEVRRKDTMLVDFSDAPQWTGERWVPFIKGADGKSWMEDVAFVIDWTNAGLRIATFSRSRFGRGATEYFKKGIAISTIGASFTARAHTRPSIFGHVGTSLFPADIPGALLSLNGAFAREVASALNPTIHFLVGDVARVPYEPMPDADKIWHALASSFLSHERTREPSVEFCRPGPSTWSSMQRWVEERVGSGVIDSEPASPTAQLSFAVGVALGRFGANGEGILTEAPATALSGGVLYLSAASDDDDLASPSAKVIVDAWDRYGAEIDDKRKLKDYLRDKFFPDVHCKMYEKRPIYFPLSSGKRTFVAFISIHRWTNKTLTDLLAEHLLPEKKRLLGQKADLATARDGVDKKAARAAEKHLDSLVEWLNELDDFICKVEEIAHKGPPAPDAKTSGREVDAAFTMDLDDGVMINSAAMWPLLEPQWKAPKQWWKELANAEGKKDYDWAHLASRYFPSRVDAKCKSDPSLAVAHRCFWKYHPARAYQWELRLQAEIRPDFTIDEPDSGAARKAFLADHANLAREMIAKESVRRERKRAKAAGPGDEMGSDDIQAELVLDDEEGAEELTV
jgi:hypothetical protein